MNEMIYPLNAPPASGGGEAPRAKEASTFTSTAALIPQIAACGCVQDREASAASPLPEPSGAPELHLIREGYWRAWIGCDAIACAPGDLLVVRPGETCRLTETSRRRCTRYWLRLAPAAADSLDLDRAAPRPLACSWPLAALFELLLKEHRHPQAGSPEYTQALYQSLVFAIRRDHQRALESGLPARAACPSPWASQVIALLGEQAGSPDSGLSAVAARLGLAERELRSRFLAEVGCTPAQHLIRQRVRLAQQRLAESPQRVTQIAFDLGFSSSQYFATFFRKHVGQSPAEYRSGRQHMTRPASASVPTARAS